MNDPDHQLAEQDRDVLLARERASRIEAEEVQHRLSFLAEASNVLASSLDYETTLGAVARLAIPQLADWCTVHIREDDGAVRLLAVEHIDPAKVRYMLELDKRYPYNPDTLDGVAGVMRTGRPELVREIPEEMLRALGANPEMKAIFDELKFTSWMIVPLATRHRILGTITMVSAESGQHFDQDDLDMAMDLGRRAALAVDNARLYRRASKAAAEQTAILEHMADGVVMVDRQGTVAYLNAAAREMMGLEGQGHPFDAWITAHQIKASEDQGPEPTVLGRALQGETVLKAEVTLRGHSGRDLAMSINATPIITEEGVQLGAVLVFHDITAERDMERQRTAFLSAAAHDLNTPLTVVRGLAQLLRRRVERGDTSRLLDDLDQITASTTRMARLISELLDLSRVQMGESLDITPVSLDLVALLRRVIEDNNRTTRHHRIVFRANPDQIRGTWDANRLDRVFSNLLSNAIKYSPEGGTITVTVDCVEGCTQPVATVRVQDEGMGIPPDAIARIFDRFYRARNVEHSVPGTGIGLSGSKHIVEQHGGSIAVESREGEGTTITVTLPLVAPLPADTPAAP